MHRLIAKWTEDPKGLHDYLMAHSATLIEDERQLFIHAYNTGKLIEMDAEQYFFDTYGNKED